MQKKLTTIFGIGLLLLLSFYAGYVRWLSKTRNTEPSFERRSLVTIDEDIRTIWEYDSSHIYDITLTSDSKGNIYYTEKVNRASLVQFNPFSGVTEWVQETPFDEISNRLLSKDGILLSVNATTISAYDTGNGLNLWTTKLGTGHVDTTIQWDSPIVREYYGQQVFEISPESGEIVSSFPLGKILWVEGDYEVRQDPSGKGGISGNQRSTGTQLWKKQGMPFLREPIPQQYNNHLLIIKTRSEDFCALDLEQGVYTWCLDGRFISNLAVDEEFGWGYLLRDDYQLARIDLSTGSTLASISFLPREQMRNTEDGPYRYQNFLGVAKDQTIIINFGDSNQLIGLSWK